MKHRFIRKVFLILCAISVSPCHGEESAFDAFIKGGETKAKIKVEMTVRINQDEDPVRIVVERHTDKTANFAAMSSQSSNATAMKWQHLQLAENQTWEDFWSKYLVALENRRINCADLSKTDPVEFPAVDVSLTYADWRGSTSFSLSRVSQIDYGKITLVNHIATLGSYFPDTKRYFNHVKVEPYNPWKPITTNIDRMDSLLATAKSARILVFDPKYWRAGKITYFQRYFENHDEPMPAEWQKKMEKSKVALQERGWKEWVVAKEKKLSSKEIESFRSLIIPSCRRGNGKEEFSVVGNDGEANCAIEVKGKDSVLAWMLFTPQTVSLHTDKGSTGALFLKNPPFEKIIEASQ